MKLNRTPRIRTQDAELERALRDIAIQVNGLSEGSIEANYTARDAVPSSGTWKKSDFVRNTAPVEAGSAGSKYVVFGWIRITDGSGNTINTDWLACRFLTGN